MSATHIAFASVMTVGTYWMLVWLCLRVVRARRAGR